MNKILIHDDNDSLGICLFWHILGKCTVVDGCVHGGKQKMFSVQMFSHISEYLNATDDIWII